MSWDTTIPEYQAIHENVRNLSDEDLAKELYFAEAADDPHPNAKVWLKALREETERRS